jgi:hypothetical protein
MNANRMRGLTAALPLALLLALPSAAGAVERKLVATDGQAEDRAGWSVAVDGDTAVVGAPFAAESTGAVYVFSRSGDEWLQTAKLTASDGGKDEMLGVAVAIDGDTIVAGASHDDAGSSEDQGAVYTFSRNGPADRTETAKLTASNGQAMDQLGFAVAIDGDTIVAGAPSCKVGSNTYQGCVYTFARTGGVVRTETAELTASDGAAVDQFGSAVAIDGDTIVVGSPGSIVNQGAAYTFARSGAAARTETGKLVTILGAAYDGGGLSVAISGETIAVGAPQRDVLGRMDQGAVYTFTRTGAATRAQTNTLTASDGAANDNLGSSVAIDRGSLVSGAPGGDVASNPDQGVAYEFALPGQGGHETGKLTPSDGAASDSFAEGLAAEGGTVIGGSFRDSVGTNMRQGSASIFFPPAPTGESTGTDTGTGTGPGLDVTAPVLSRLRVAPAHVRRSARVSYRLSEPATVLFTLRRAIRRRGHTRYVPMRGSFTRAGRLGDNRFRFTGRVGHRALKAGRYRLVATATDAAGNSAAPRAVRFRRERLFRPGSRH